MKKFLEEQLRKRAPKGVDPKKHERCVQDVKDQGRSVGSAHAICTASMKKAQHTDKLPGGKADKHSPKDFDQKQLQMGIKVEMEHTNDRSLAQEIAMDHLAEDANYYSKLKQIHVEKSGVSTMSSKDSRLASKIEQHNRKKLHAFAKKQKLKKSIDFQQTKTAVDSADQLLAEQTTSPELISYLKTSVDNDITKIPFSKGMLTVSQKEPGLYNAFFQDNQGQIVEKFDSQTLEIIAKNMMLKQLWSGVAAAPSIAPNHDAVEELEDRVIAAHEAQLALERHNAVYHQGQQPGEPIGSKAKTLKVRFGDFEIELRKSIKDFISDFKKSQSVNSSLVQKAIKTWRKRMEGCMSTSSDQDAAKILFNNWDEYHEDFCQIVYALQQMNKYE